ncbi:AAEL000366-PA [Aedes aegypti]|uniref:AAEL000366-PA n=1 Tax=Aedes aegypti TaxID=7159 RepID=Q17PD4_AEDAE|nr:AAEL000366-PA [Aedes aegypti]
MNTTRPIRLPRSKLGRGHFFFVPEEFEGIKVDSSWVTLIYLQATTGEPSTNEQHCGAITTELEPLEACHEPRREKKTPRTGAILLIKKGFNFDKDNLINNGNWRRGGYGISLDATQGYRAGVAAGFRGSLFSFFLLYQDDDDDDDDGNHQ